MAATLPKTLAQFTTASGHTGRLHQLSALDALGAGPIARLPVCLRIVLESVVRNCDGKRITAEHVRQLAGWRPSAERTEEIPFVVARVVLQDFTGVPLLCDLAAMRSVADRMDRPAKAIEPLVPVDLVVDHSVQVDYFGTLDALHKNMEMEFQRNRERYQFMKWGMQAFDGFRVVPPGIGIVHQVNLEYLFHGVRNAPGDDLYYPDTLVGTDSHTTMINALGVVGWGVGGIEAEAAMLGQPVYILTPDVVGVELTGALPEGTTATDLVLTVTERLRKEKVVGCFVEFFGEGTASLSVTDRATIANMAPEYGATMGFFPVDDKTVDYMRKTGREEADCERFEAWFRAQGMFGIPRAGEVDYTRVVKIDLDALVPSLAGPKRPQDRIELPAMRERFESLFVAPSSENGFNKPPSVLHERYPTEMTDVDLGHGDVLIAAITSCTNTSNPAVMIAAGLLAKNAVARGLHVKPHIKTSLAPGSRVVTDYLTRAGLIEPLAELGFTLAGYGCTTCIGNAGDLTPELNEAIAKHDVIAASVLSGNRNFEARIHPNIRANFLASPPLVVAYALAGTVNIDLSTEPLGTDEDGQAVYLKDIWPGSEDINAALPYAQDPVTFRKLYSDFSQEVDLWSEIPAPTGDVYDWPASTYIAQPPFFDGFDMTPPPVGDIHDARALLLLGDSVTTDHISPAGRFSEQTPAGQWLVDAGVDRKDFNSYGSRRGNHEVMMRGTFANVRIKNLMLPPDEHGSRIEGGFTLYDGEQTTVFDAASRYMAANTPTVVFAGEEYGTGSSRDWAAKGTLLLGVKAVVANSFERIHRSNLVGMGVLPLQFMAGTSWQSLDIGPEDRFDIEGIEAGLAPRQTLTLRIHRTDGSTEEVPLRSRIDTEVEVAYFRHGGILPYVLRQILA
ncbi:aconitate hydratase AcnA [Nitrogeniibacter mangrovi]|uniref:Aconitate hydratase n=1 Tax=Nitrogeniibacter mangrovi TaxID=2016596 RepID=A0A6C1B673_9RHOO|nr:aconitate hydratase AcnA [Nitrogeniibacter mangrovi]QID18208.1 aconitate hydratase AcnA [Nitrogeniibacter mangrovi]